MSVKGFKLEVVYCATCAETAEAIPQGDYSAVDGLPIGWVAVKVSKYRAMGKDEPTSDFDARWIYYCSEAHLPSELLPEIPAEATP